MKQSSAALVAAVILVMAGCGGGGGSSTPAPTGTTLAVSGTAAAGRAMAGATVVVKCGSATGTATTAADGSYSLSLSAAELPCVVQATGTGGAPVYRSAVVGSGAGPFTANASPLSELILAQIAGAAGTTPAALFSAYDTQRAALTAASLAAGLGYLRSASVVDLTGVNPLSDVLVAANGGNAGNALDGKIDALIAKLATAQTTLDAWVAAVVANPTVPATLTQAGQPAATDCASLKTGSYRMINPFETDPLFRAHLLNIDAVTLGFTSLDSTGTPDPTGTGTLVSEGAGSCSFTVGDATETNKVMVDWLTRWF